MGEKVVCTTVSLHLCVHLPHVQLHSDFGDLNNGVCYFMKIFIAESNPAMALSTHKHFALAPGVLARAKKVSIMTMPVACDLGLAVEYHGFVCHVCRH